VVALNITAPSGLDSKSLEALQKAVFEFSGGDAGLKSDMSQYEMQLHVCSDSHSWCSGGGGADAALSTSFSFATAGTSTAGTSRSRATLVGSDNAITAASTHIHHTAAAAAAVQQQILLHALVLSQQTVKTLRSDIEYAPIFTSTLLCFLKFCAALLTCCCEGCSIGRSVMLV
jgi:hypothetical protein